MNQKKKKIITTVGMVLFFLTGGIWYVWQGEGLPWQQTEANSIQSVFAEENRKSEVSPTSAPETGIVQNEDLELVVHICGAVNCPGVYTLAAGSRLYEAVTMAGGFSAEADPTYHNLARYLEDEERIYILTYAETKELTVQEKAEGEEGAEVTSVGTLINLNTATKEQLTTLPGIGEARAESILEYRAKVGTFTDIEEIMNISGIGEAMFAKIRDKITVK